MQNKPRLFPGCRPLLSSAAGVHYCVDGPGQRGRAQQPGRSGGQLAGWARLSAMALTAMKSMRQRLGRQGGLTYEVEVVAQHAGERRRRGEGAPLGRRPRCPLCIPHRPALRARARPLPQPTWDCRPARVPCLCSSAATGCV